MIFENGSYTGLWPTSVPAAFKPTFHWQILSRASSLQVAIRNILLIPTLVAPGVSTPWDVSFSAATVPSAKLWSIKTQANNPLPVTFGTDNLEVSSPKLSIRNSATWTQLALPTAASGIIMYRMRVNASGGSETKVTVMGGNILRITGNGSSVTWNLFDAGGLFQKLSDSLMKVGSQQWTTVTLVYSPTSVALFEDNLFRFKRTYTGGTPGDAVFWVQHLDVGTPVSVQLTNFRGVPLAKTTEMLAMDMAPDVLLYYPLKADLAETVIGDPSLALAAVNGFVPRFIPGLFGPAMNFSGQQGSLKMPSALPFSRTLPSYTLTLWTQINNYPPTGKNVNISGPLSIRPDGKLAFSFLFSGTDPLAMATYVSQQVVPKSQWVSIIVTYASEESRLSIFINGSLDSVFYTTADSSSRAAVTPFYGYIGCNVDSNGNMTMFDGAIGDIQIFDQHVHDAVASALASRTASLTYSAAGPSANGSVEAPQVFLLIPLMIGIAVFAMTTTALYAWYQSKSSQPELDIDEVVKRITDKVGFPARPGAKVSRQDISLPADYPIYIDVHGTGYRSSPISSGMVYAINVNDSEFDYSEGKYPHLVKVAAWSTNPILPFADGFVDHLTCFGDYITDQLAAEFARVLNPTTGVIEVLVPALSWSSVRAAIVNAIFDKLSMELQAVVEKPDTPVRFTGNGQEWYRLWRIRAQRH